MKAGEFAVRCCLAIALSGAVGVVGPVGIASAHDSASHASSSGAVGAPHGKSTTVRGDLEAKVVSVDSVAGSMIARGDDGIERHFVLDSKTRHVASELKEGDRVDVTFDRTVTVSLRPDGSTAQPATDANSFDATVVGVDKKSKMVSIRGPKGNVFDIDVERADVLDKLKENSIVHVEFGRPIALSITKK